MQHVDWLGRTVTVRVEAPRGTFVKRAASGSVDFVSPLPVPFNYGCVPGELGGDGDPLDAILLGPRRPAGFEQQVEVWGVVAFVDKGAVDTKLVCGQAITRADRLAVHTFFAVYAPAKRVLAWWRGQRGRTAVDRIVWA